MILLSTAEAAFRAIKEIGFRVEARGVQLGCSLCKLLSYIMFHVGYMRFKESKECLKV